jgi:hypothetical protein
MQYKNVVDVWSASKSGLVHEFGRYNECASAQKRH